MTNYVHSAASIAAQLAAGEAKKRGQQAAPVAFAAPPKVPTVNPSRRRELLSLTPAGKAALAEQDQLNPDAAAAAAGISPARRRQLLEASAAGRKLLADEDKAARERGR